MCLPFAVGCAGTAGKGAPSEWVREGKASHLLYKQTPAGDRIIDFSHAGYMGGGVALPQVSERVRVTPSADGSDDTARIQEAVDRVSAMPLVDGFRGAVVLAPGTFTCAKTITIRTPGVVLRGSVSGSNKEGGTTLRMTGGKHAAIVIAGSNSSTTRGSSEDDSPGEADTRPAEHAADARTTLSEKYVPCGATSFAVANAQGFSAGDLIAIRRPTTAAWVKFMGMDAMTRDGGRPQTWIGTNRAEIQERRITAVTGNRITIDVPLADSYDAQYLGENAVTVTRAHPSPGRVTNVGVEHLRIACEPMELAYGEHPYSALRIGGDDCWARDVVCDETMNTTVMTGRRITLQRVHVHHTYPNLGASKPADFSFEGSQILVDRCSSTGGNTYWVWTSSLKAGPNVVLNSVFRGHGGRVQPHQRWATGLLVDNCTVPDGGIDFMNRGVAGSGHGWAMGWGVAWNCVAKTYIIQQPPGSMNWAIGCTGERVRQPRLFETAPLLDEGTFESHGQPVWPQSLYLAQLADRLGPQGLRNIGYAGNDATEFAAGNATPPLPPQKREDDPQLGPDLALHRPVGAPGLKGTHAREHAGEKAVDADPSTYWSPGDSASRATWEVDLEGPVEIDTLAIEEAPGMEGRIQQYRAEAQVDSDWKVLSEGATVGQRKIDRFPKVTAWKVRLTILKSNAPIGVRKVGLYHSRP